MISMQARPLTDISYMLATDSGERFGIMLNKNEKIELITPESINYFSSLSELEELLGSPVHFVKPVVKNDQPRVEIDGYPIKHEEFYSVEEIDGINTYRGSPNSKVRWVPGWWGIRFTRGFIGFFCPKLATLAGNEFIGPFKNKFDTEHAVKLKNRELRESA